MSLPQKYEVIFREECDRLSVNLCNSLLHLKENPTDSTEIKNIVQAADTIMGNARFLGNKILEDHATMIVKEFSKVDDVQKRIEQLTCLIMGIINN